MDLSNWHVVAPDRRVDWHILEKASPWEQLPREFQREAA
jgi:hypothetical protein